MGREPGRRQKGAALAVAARTEAEEEARVARAAHKAARRAAKRSAAAFSLESVSDQCAALVLDADAGYVDVQAVTARQRADATAIASLYGLAVRSTKEKRVLRISRSPYVMATLPEGQVEVALVCVLSRGADAIDVAAVVTAHRAARHGGGTTVDEAVPLRKRKQKQRQPPQGAMQPVLPTSRAAAEVPPAADRAASPTAGPTYKLTWCIDRG